MKLSEARVVAIRALDQLGLLSAGTRLQNGEPVGVVRNHVITAGGDERALAVLSVLENYERGMLNDLLMADIKRAVPEYENILNRHMIERRRRESC